MCTQKKVCDHAAIGPRYVTASRVMPDMKEAVSPRATAPAGAAR